MHDPNQPGYPQAPGHPGAQPTAYPPQAQTPAGVATPGYPPPALPPGQPGLTAPVGVVPQASGYEFTEQENVTVERAAAWAKGLGLLMFVQCGLQLINLNVIGVLLYVVLGVLFWRGGAALTKVVETQGNDVGHLLEAMRQLGQALLLRIVVVSAAAVILLLVGVITAIAVLA